MGERLAVAGGGRRQGMVMREAMLPVAGEAGEMSDWKQSFWGSLVLNDRHSHRDSK